MRCCGRCDGISVTTQSRTLQDREQQRELPRSAWGRGAARVTPFRHKGESKRMLDYMWCCVDTKREQERMDARERSERSHEQKSWKLVDGNGRRWQWCRWCWTACAPSLRADGRTAAAASPASTRQCRGGGVGQQRRGTRCRHHRGLAPDTAAASAAGTATSLAAQQRLVTMQSVDSLPLHKVILIFRIGTTGSRTCDIYGGSRL